jgi:trimethylamine--corrinoid protein Co-methyltransferase
LTIDNDICGMAYRLLEGVAQRNSPMALDLLTEVGHQSAFLGLSHTREWYRSEQYFPAVLDRGNVDQWLAAGKPTLATRSAWRVSELLKEGPVPVIGEEKQRELRRIMLAHAHKAGMVQLPMAASF